MVTQSQTHPEEDQLTCGLQRMDTFDSRLSRMNCQTFSTGLSSGHLAGSGMIVMFGGTAK